MRLSTARHGGRAAVTTIAAAETWLSNYGSVVNDKLDVMPFSSRGPREDGGFKPNITAPGAAISTADLDLSVYRGTTLVGQSADGDSDESVSLANPAAGTYTVVIVGYSVPAGTTQYDYRDVFYSPALGTLSAPSALVNLVNGQSTTISGTVTAVSAPSAGRQLFGELVVVSDQGAVLGRGSVIIGAVG